jgi:hypothetical protein
LSFLGSRPPVKVIGRRQNDVLRIPFATRYLRWRLSPNHLKDVGSNLVDDVNAQSVGMHGSERKGEWCEFGAICAKLLKVCLKKERPERIMGLLGYGPIS